MSQLNPEKLHVDCDETIVNQKSALGRKYTLTHSDIPGELFLTIRTDYKKGAISGWYTKLMRDEFLGEWVINEDLALHILFTSVGDWSSAQQNGGRQSSDSTFPWFLKRFAMAIGHSSRPVKRV